MPQSLRVLIVEDNPHDAELVVRALQRGGFELEWTRVESEADYLAQLRPDLDLILSDFAMPQFSGLRALELLNERGLDVPFILVSGTIGEDTAVEAMKHGASDYLIKDRLARLGAAVTQALREFRLRRERRKADAALVESERFNRATLDSLSAHIAILDEHGTILAVNNAWRVFAADNALPSGRAAVGENYLRVCDHASGPLGGEARLVGDAIRTVLGGRPAGREVEYPCHSPTERRWFVARVTPFPGDGPRRAVVAHENITERKLAEAAVVASERHYRLLFESNPEPMWVYDLETFGFLAVNPAAVEHYGFSREEFLAMTIKDIRPPETLPLLEADLRATATGRSGPALWRHRKKDGTEIDVEITSNDLQFAGRPARLVLAMDVTERQRVERELRWKTAFLEAQVSSSPDGILVVGEHGTKVLQNERLNELLKIPRHIAENSDDRPQREWFTTRTKNPAQFAEKTAYLMEHRDEVSRDAIELVDGIVLDRYSAPVVDKGGQYYGRIWTFRDVTEGVRAERTLRESEERFRGLIENATDLIAVVDVLGRIEYQSPSAQRLLGYLPSEVLGHLVTDFIHPADSSIATEGIARALSDAPPKTVEYRIRHRAGGWRVFQSIGRLLPEPGGRKLIVVNSRDVTETRELESRFLRAQRMEAIGTLAGGIAHDLNNILAPMLMVVPLLRDKVADVHDREMLTLIEQSAKRGASVIKQLLTFSRGIAGDRGAVQLRHLLKEMASIMRETFPREISIEVNLETELWPIVGDATQIHQVLMNLCVNARDAMPAGGNLALMAENITPGADDVAARPGVKPGEFVRVTVADSGEGIAPEIIERIFEPFFTTKEVGKGTGLGLSTVLGIVTSHGGFLTVDSKAGGGSSFHFYLPAAGETNAPPHAAGPTSASGRQELILVVDDELAVRQALSAVLRQNNYRVLGAANGIEAERIFREHHDEVRLVLTDVMMPGLGGVALVRSLRALAPRLAIVAITGLRDASRLEELAALGVNQVLAKPFTSSEILTAVRAELSTLAPDARVSAANSGAED